MLKTHNCGELNTDFSSQTVILCGWVARRRDHGKIIFLDLRDRTGTVQLTVIPRDAGDFYKIAQDIRSEFVLRVTGIVNKRPAANINPNLATGEIEVLVKEIEVLNPSLNPPFEIEEESEVAEDSRLKYRYLDLRRRKIFNNLLLRSKLYKTIRSLLDTKGFIECETPILTKSTPEGARDYLVPSRLNPGQFYALPQSPQLFKQILMVAGIERYYQIAKCFRDEDLRADRQPEFTQLDIEMSFIGEEDIFALTEELMRRILREIKNIDIKIPFSRITYKQAQERYGSDKPDLRKEQNNDFAFVWVVDFPLFKYNEEEKRWESEHHPFTSVRKQDLEILEKEPGKVLARSYDLVLNGMEIGSGSIRIHDQKLQERIFKIIGIDREEAYRRFGFLLEAFQYGAPPHGGIAFGLDRLLAILAGEESIREVITFPKTSAGICPLTGAPSEVDARQLKELNLTITKERRKGMKMMHLVLFLLLALSFIFSGCIVRTYPLTRERVDQDLNIGNRGYLKGSAPKTIKQRPTTRTTQVIEVEMGSPIKFEKAPKAETTEEKLPVITEESVSEGNRGYITESVSPEINEPYSEGAFKNYTVQKNDTLQKISKKYYGTTKKWHQIYEANKDILKTPDRLYVGQILKIPVIKKELKEPAEKLK